MLLHYRLGFPGKRQMQAPQPVEIAARAADHVPEAHQFRSLVHGLVEFLVEDAEADQIPRLEASALLRHRGLQQFCDHWMARGRQPVHDFELDRQAQYMNLVARNPDRR
jgi:hypothetical protein